MKEYLASLLYESLIQNETYVQIMAVHQPIFVPIPLFKEKLRQRGYNQSYLLAQSLAELEEGRVMEILQRQQNTKPQYGLSREERMDNIKGAFGVKKNIVIPSTTTWARNPSGISHVVRDDMKTVFLVDDVVTTGSTLVEAANVLKRCGFKHVWGITFAQD